MAPKKTYRATHGSTSGYGFTCPDPTFNRLGKLEFTVEGIGDDPDTETRTVEIVLEPEVWDFIVRGLAKEHARQTFGL